MGKGQSFQEMVLGRLDISCKRMTLDPYLTPYTKFNQKWIKGVYVRAKSINLWEETG